MLSADFLGMMTYYSSYTENEVYYYHGDLCGSRAQSQACLSYAEMQQSVRSKHLGGASWITDGDGVPVQHLQYLPFGEPFVDQHPAGYQERYTFTGKERDEETGYGYFGARYMDHELMTSWLSVDPMSNKYPNISPYNYCMWNPVKIIDPNGMDTLFSIATNLPDNNQNKENSIILSWMREEGDIPGMVSICMHGDPQKVRMSNTDGNFESPLSAKGLATLFELGGFPDYEKNVQANKTTIFLLYCCNTGQGDNSFGEQFSLEMQGIVIAPEGRVCVPNDSHNLYNWTNKNTPINQPWNVYYRGRLVTSFTGILPREWINNQGGIESATQKIIDTDRNAHPWGWHPWWK